LKDESDITVENITDMLLGYKFKKITNIKIIKLNIAGSLGEVRKIALEYD
jgi:hypothetical protein